MQTIHRNNSLLSVFFASLCFLLISCNNSNETIIIDPDHKISHSNKSIEINYGTVIDSISFSGKSSVLLTKENPFGLTVNLKNVNALEVYTVSVYRSANNPLVKLVADGSWENHYHQAAWHSKSENGWQEIKLRLKVPENVTDGDLRFYVYNISEKPCFVDHMQIKKSSEAQDFLIPDYQFYPLLYDILNDYHLINFQSLDLEKLHEFISSKRHEKLFTNHGTDIDEFNETFKQLKSQAGINGMLKVLKQMKSETHFPSIALRWENEMDSQKLSAYAVNMFCEANDTAKIIIKNKQDCKAIRMFQLKQHYQSGFIREIAVPNDSLLSIPLENLDKGIYKITLYGDADSFALPLLINDNKKNDVLILAPYTTWQAYNTFGGKSFYANGIDSADVNFLAINRPINSIYFDSVYLEHDIFILNNIFQWFDTNYRADIYPDYYLEAHPEKLKNYKTIVLAQHCEYFSPAMFLELEQMSEQANLMSLGGNQIYWKIRWHNNFSTMECRKDGDFFKNSFIPGGLWRNKLTSEARLLGVAYTDAGYASYAPYEVLDAAHFLYGGTNAKPNSLFGKEGIDKRGLSGDEMDKIFIGTPENTEHLAKGTNPNNGGGDLVFINRDNYATLSCGSIACGSGLGKDKVFTQIVKNFMEAYH